MEAGVAACADCNQPVAVVDARLTMMDMEPVGRPTGAALVAIALQNFPTQAGEVLPRVGGGPIAGAAEAGGPGEIPAAVAEQGALGKSSQKRLYSRIAVDN